MLSGPAWSKESAHKKSPEAQYLWASEPSMRSVREKIRTPDLLIRSQTLYSIELRDQFFVFSGAKILPFFELASIFANFFSKNF